MSRYRLVVLLSELFKILTDLRKYINSDVICFAVINVVDYYPHQLEYALHIDARLCRNKTRLTGYKYATISIMIV
ncbi:MAG: hypothetical protein ACTS7E_01540 [Arsenophonus sp. NC-CH8-MAG3]